MTRSTYVQLHVWAGLIAGGFCVAAGIYLLDSQTADENSYLEVIAHGMGWYFIGKGVFVAAALSLRPIVPVDDVPAALPTPAPAPAPPVTGEDRAPIESQAESAEPIMAWPRASRVSDRKDTLLEHRGTLYALAAGAAIVAVIAVVAVTQAGGESSNGKGVDRDEEIAKVEAVAKAKCQYKGQTDDGSLYECGSYYSPKRYVVDGDDVTPA